MRKSRVGPFSSRSRRLVSFAAISGCSQSPPRGDCCRRTSGPAEQEIQTGPLAAHVRMLSHDVMEGRAPSTRGGTLAAEYLATQLATAGIEPAGDNGTYFQQVPIVESVVDRSFTLSVPGARLSLLRRRRGVFGDRAVAGACAGRRRVRRSWHRRARAEVERLRGRRREGQVGDGHGQRPAGAARRAEPVRRQGAHLLRTLDLQVRGGGASGRGRRDSDSHRRIGHLSVAGGAVVVDRHAVFAAARGGCAGAGHQGVDAQRRRQRSRQARRPGPRSAARGRREARIQGRAAQSSAPPRRCSSARRARPRRT